MKKPTKKRCKHPNFRFKYFEEYVGEGLYKWKGMGYKLVCGKCRKPITVEDIRRQ